MFGYVIPNHTALSPEAQARYRTAYCGLCRRLGAQTVGGDARRGRAPRNLAHLLRGRGAT